MPDYYKPDLGADPNNPFARDQDGKLARRSYWLAMIDNSIISALTQGVGAHLTNEEKRAHIADIRRDHLLDDIVVQEILPPEH